MIPQIPPKLIFGNFKKENLDKRQAALQKYMDNLLCCVDIAVSETVGVLHM